MPAPESARALVRRELTRQILEAATRRLAVDGPAALSLRSVARDLQMAPSALYRYFDGRDALLHALILAAYRSLADEAAGASQTGDPASGDAERWCRAPRAIRAWALSHPHQWALIFGSPVPGYEAPEDTVQPYTRVAATVVMPIATAWGHGRLHPLPAPADDSDELRAAVAPIEEALVPGMPAPLVAQAVQAWATIVGSISLEVFGHWRNAVLDPGRVFEVTLQNLARQLGLAATAGT